MSSDESNNQRNRRFLARYGAIILRGGIATIPKALYRYQAELELKPQQVWFISAILTHKWDEDMPRPSLKRMAIQTGVTEQALHNYKNQLVTAGWLAIVHRHNDRGGQESSYYDFSVLFGALEERLRRDRPRKGDQESEEEDEDEGPSGDLRAVDNPRTPGGGGLNRRLAPGLNRHLVGGLNGRLALKESVEKEALEKEADQYSNGSRAITSHKIKTDRYGKEKQFRIRSNVDNSAREAPKPSSEPPAGFTRVGQVLTDRRDTPPPAARSRRGRPPKAPPYIEQVIVEFSARLHDSDHTQANITQATRLWRASGLPEAQFVQDVLYQARSLTQAQGNVTKRATDGTGTINRMPYFFRVVEDLLGLREDQPPPPPPELRGR